MHCVYRGLNVAEILGNSEKLAMAYSTVAFVTKRLDYAAKAQNSAPPGTPTSAFCSMLYGGMSIGEGEFMKAEEALKISITVSKSARDLATLGLSMSVLGWALFCQGKFEEALALSEKILNLGKMKDDTRFVNWGRNSKVRDLLALQRHDEAREMMRDIDAHITAEGGLAKFLKSDQVHFVGFRVVRACQSQSYEPKKCVLE